MYRDLESFNSAYSQQLQTLYPQCGSKKFPDFVFQENSNLIFGSRRKNLDR
jgi:hypothetical protein